MKHSFFDKIDAFHYNIYSQNGNKHSIEFQKAFQTPFIQFVFGTQCQLYEMYFENTLVVSNEVDNEMFDIVDQILVDFMHEENNNLLYYSISRVDGRNEQLFRLYSIWFKKICQKTKWLAKSDKILLEGNKVIDHISCIFNANSFKAIDMNETLNNILNELYPHCTVKSL